MKARSANGCTSLDGVVIRREFLRGEAQREPPAETQVAAVRQRDKSVGCLEIGRQLGIGFLIQGRSAIRGGQHAEAAYFPAEGDALDDVRHTF
jgi:hypothetical protein